MGMLLERKPRVNFQQEGAFNFQKLVEKVSELMPTDTATPHPATDTTTNLDHVNVEYKVCANNVDFNAVGHTTCETFVSNATCT